MIGYRTGEKLLSEQQQQQINYTTEIEETEQNKAEHNRTETNQN